MIPRICRFKQQQIRGIIPRTIYGSEVVGKSSGIKNRPQSSGVQIPVSALTVPLSTGDFICTSAGNLILLLPDKNSGPKET